MTPEYRQEKKKELCALMEELLVTADAGQRTEGRDRQAEAGQQSDGQDLQIDAGQRADALEQRAESLLWEVLRAFAGEVFETAKGLRFTYYIKGNEMFVSRKDKSITRATAALAFHTAVALQRAGEGVKGPKKLKTFGASYLFPLFLAFGVIRKEEKGESD